MFEDRLKKRFLFLSALAHVLFWAGLLSREPNEIESTYPPLVEVEIIPVPPPVEQPAQVVDQVPRPENKVSDEAKFLSANDAQVEKETRADFEGKFQNSPKPESQIEKETDISADEKSDELKRKEEKASEVSRNEDYLKDIEKGMETVLSTRQFQYFAYYNLIKEKIRPHWEPGIREKFKMEIRKNRSIASKLDHTTQVLLVLSPEGSVVSIEVLIHSGSVNLDNAAVEAFKKAQPFPKPPPGLIESDGKVRLLWDFVLET